MPHRPGARSAIVAFAAAAMLISGCTAPDSPSTTSTYSPELAQALLELGPYPTPAPLTESERDAQLSEGSDREWAEVLTSFPDAIRPDVEVIETVSTNEYRDKRRACLTEAGETIAPGDEWEPDGTEASAILGYVCAVEFPITPGRPFSDLELGYLYDFLTGFTVPCMSARGYETDPPISREAFVTKWPNQNWYPYPGGLELMAEESEQLLAECPTEPPTLAAARR